MSFSELVAHLLNQTLGPYIEGFNAKNIELSVLAGKALMHNLEIKKDALDSFDLPVVIKKGLIGKIELHLPWTNLETESAKVTIENLYVVVSPTPAQIRSEKEQALREQNTKQSLLSLAKLTGQDLPTAKEADKIKKKEAAANFVQEYIEGVAMKVLDNLQLTIKNIHIRYEDTIANPAKPVAIGLMIGDIKMLSTDKDWKVCFNTARRTIINKILDINNFSLYFDTSPKFVDCTSQNTFSSTMTKMIQLKEGTSDSISISAKAEINTTGDVTETPQGQAILTVTIERLNGSLEPAQFQSINDIVSWYTLWQKKNQYHKFHPPSVPVSQSPQAWWRFLVQALASDVQEKAKKWSWSWIKARATDQKQYISIYQKIVKLQQLTADEQAAQQQIEYKYSYEDLLSWRKLANAFFVAEELRSEKIEAALAARRAKRGFWENLITSDTNVSKEVGETALSDLYRLIGFESKLVERKTLAPESVIAFLKIELKECSFRLNDGPEGIIEIHGSGLDAEVKIFPQSSEVKIHCKEFEILDLHTIPTKPVEFLAIDWPKVQKFENQVPRIVEILVQVNPPDRDVELALFVKTQPILVTFSRPVVDRIALFFGTKHNSALLEKLLLASTQGLEAVQKQIENEIRYALQDQPKLYMDLDVSSITAVAPANLKEIHCPALVVNTGNLHLKTNLTSHIEQRETGSDPEKNPLFFDTYSVVLSDICAFSALDYSKWRDERIYLLNNFSLNVVARVRRVPISELPNFIVDGSIDSLSITVERVHLFSILQVARELMKPLPFENEVKKIGHESKLTPLTRQTTRVDLKRAMSLFQPTALTQPKQLEGPQNAQYQVELKDAPILKLYFTMKSMDIQFNYGELMEAQKPLLKIALRTVNTTMSLSSYGASVLGLVHYLNIQNMLDYEPDKPSVYLFESQLEDEKSDHLLEIKYKWTDSSANKHYQNIDNHLELTLSKVVLTIDRPLLAAFVRVGLYALKQIKKDFGARAPPKSVAVLAGKDEEYLQIFQDLGTNQTAAQREKLIQNRLKRRVASDKRWLKLTLNAKQFEVFLLKKRQSFAVIQLSSLTMCMEALHCALQSGTAASLTLECIHQTQTKWDKLLALESADEPVISFAGFVYPKTLEDNYPGYDVQLSANILSLRANMLLTNILRVTLYFKQFYEEIQHHVFTLQTELGQLVEASASTSGPPKVKIDLNIVKGLQFMMPQSRRDGGGLLCHFGPISMTTSFIETKQHTLAEYIIQLPQWDLFGEQILPGSPELQRTHIIDKASVTMHVRVPLEQSELMKIPEAFVKIATSELICNFDHFSTMHFLRVVNGNFQEPFEQFDDELMTVRMTLGASPMNDPNAALVWTKAHVELVFAEFRVCLLEKPILNSQNVTEAPSEPNLPILNAHLMNLHGNVLVSNKEAVDVVFRASGCMISFPRASMIKEIVTFSPKENEDAVYLRTKVDDTKLLIDIEFFLNGPHATPTTEFISTVVKYAATKLVPPFNAIQKDFTKFTQIQLRNTKSDLVNFGVLSNEEQVKNIVNLDFAMKRSSVAFAKSFTEQQTEAFMAKIELLTLKFQDEAIAGGEREIVMKLDLADMTLSQSKFDLKLRAEQEPNFPLLFPCTLTLSQTRKNPETRQEIASLNIAFSLLSVSISTREIMRLLGYYPTWFPMFSDTKEFLQSEELRILLASPPQPEDQPKDGEGIIKAINIELPEMKFLLCRTVGDEESTPLLEILGTKTQVKLDDTPQQHLLQLSLGELVVTTLFGATAPCARKLISLHKPSPFELRLESLKQNKVIISQKIHLAVGEVELVLDRTGLAGLIQFGAELSQLLFDFAINEKISFAKPKGTALWESDSLVSHPSERNKAEVIRLEISILKEQLPFIVAKLDKFELAVAQSTTTTIMANFAAFQIENRIENTKWKHLLLFESPDPTLPVFEAKMTQHFIPKLDPNYPGYDLDLYLRLRDAKITLVRSSLHFVITYLTSYLPVIQPYIYSCMAEHARYLSFFPPKPPKDNPSSTQRLPLHLPALEVKIAVDLATPKLFIPRHTTSEDHILVNLGIIDFQSSFEPADNGITVNVPPYNSNVNLLQLAVYQVSVKQMEIELKFKPLHSGLLPPSLMRDTELKIFAKVPADGSLNNTGPDLTLHLDVTKISLALEGEQCTFVCLVATGNLLKLEQSFDEELISVRKTFEVVNSLFPEKITQVAEAQKDAATIKSHVTVSLKELRLMMLHDHQLTANLPPVDPSIVVSSDLNEPKSGARNKFSLGKPTSPKPEEASLAPTRAVRKGRSRSVAKIEENPDESKDSALAAKQRGEKVAKKTETAESKPESKQRSLLPKKEGKDTPQKTKQDSLTTKPRTKPRQRSKSSVAIPSEGKANTNRRSVTQSPSYLQVLASAPVEDPRMIMQLILLQADIDLQMDNGVTGLTLGVQDILISGSQIKMGPANTFLSFHHPKNQKAIHLTGKIEPQNIMIKMKVVQALVLPSPFLFTNLYNFVEDFYPQLLTITKELENLEDSHQAFLKEVESKASTEVLTKKLSLEMAVDSPKFLFLSTFDQLQVPTFILDTGDLKFSITQTSHGTSLKNEISTHVKSFSFSRALLDISEFATSSDVLLASPFNISFEDDQITLDSIVLKISSQDLRVAFDGLHTWAPLITKVLQKSHLELAEKVIDAGPKAETVTLKAKLNLVDLRIMDDTTFDNWDRNILRLQLCNLDLMLLMKTNPAIINLNLSFGTQIDCFNWQKAFWEPFLEASKDKESSLSISMTSEPKTANELADAVLEGKQVGAPSYTQVDISQKSPFLINISPSLLTSLTYLLNELLPPLKELQAFQPIAPMPAGRPPSMKISKPTDANHELSSPICVRNHSGRNLTLWMDEVSSYFVMGLSSEFEAFVAFQFTRTESNKGENINMFMKTIRGFSGKFKILVSKIEESQILEAHPTKEGTWDHVSFIMEGFTRHTLHIVDLEGVSLGRVNFSGQEYISSLPRAHVSDVFQRDTNTITIPFPHRYTILKSQFESPLSISPSNRMSAEHFRFFIDENFEREKLIQWDSVGSRVFQDMTPNADLVVCSVSQDGDKGKILTIRSTEFISNKTDFPLSVRIIGIGNGKEFQTLLKAQSTCGVPLDFVGLSESQFDVSVSPDPGKYDWMSWKRGSPTVTCPQIGSPNSWRYLVIERDSLIDWSIEFHPTFLVRNSLASIFSFQIFDIKGSKREGSDKNTKTSLKTPGKILGNSRKPKESKKDKEKPSKADKEKDKSTKADNSGSKKSEKQEDLSKLQWDPSKEIAIHPMQGWNQMECPTSPASLGIIFSIKGFERSDMIRVSPLTKNEDAETTVKVKNKAGETIKFTLMREKYDPLAKDNCISLVLHCPVWIVNHTGLPLQYNNGITANSTDPFQKKNLSEPRALYDKDNKPKYYEDSNFDNVLYFDEKTLSFSLDGKAWCPEFGVGGILTLPIDTIHIQTKDPPGRFSFAVDQSKGPLSLWNTTIVRIYPAYFIVNNTDEDLRWKQATGSDIAVDVPKFSKVPLHFLGEKAKSQILLGKNNSWSVKPFDLDVGYFQIGIPLGPDQTSYYNVEVAPKGLVSTIYIVITTAKTALIYFENKTPFQATLRDERAEGEELTVAPRCAVPLRWKDSIAEAKFALKLTNIKSNWSSESIPVKLGQIGQLKFFKSEDPNTKLCIHFVGEGFTVRVFCSVVPKTLKTLLASSDAVRPDLRLSANVCLEFCVIDNKPQEMLHVTVNNLSVLVQQFPLQADVELTLQELQVDNKLLYCTKPVLAIGVPEKKRPNFLKLNTRFDTSSSLISLQLFALDLQPVVLTADLTMCFYLISYVNRLVDNLSKAALQESLQKLLAGEEPTLLTFERKQFATSTVVFFQKFQISNIVVTLNFSVAKIPFPDPDYLSPKDLGLSNQLAKFLVVGVDGGGFELGTCALPAAIVTLEQFADLLLSQYKTQLILQSIKLVGGQMIGAVAGAPLSALGYAASAVGVSSVISKMKENIGVQSSKPTMKRDFRYFDSSGRLVPWEEASSKLAITTINNGAHRKEDYLFGSVTTAPEKILITNSNLFLITPGKSIEQIPVFRLATGATVQYKTLNHKIVLKYYELTKDTWVLKSKTIIFSEELNTKNCFVALSKISRVDLSPSPKPQLAPTALERSDELQVCLNLIKESWHTYLVEVKEGSIKFNQKSYLLKDFKVFLDPHSKGSWVLANENRVVYFKCNLYHSAQFWVNCCFSQGAQLL